MAREFNFVNYMKYDYFVRTQFREILVFDFLVA